jgi:hypothetical protein
VQAATVLDAIQAMIAADPEPEHIFPVLVSVPDGAVACPVPLSWNARQAAFAVLNMTVTVARRDSGMPRRVAEMRLPLAWRLRAPHPIATCGTHPGLRSGRGQE